MMFPTPEIKGRTVAHPWVNTPVATVIYEQPPVMYFQAGTTQEGLPVVFVSVDNPFSFETVQPQQPQPSVEELNALLEESKKRTQDDLKSIEDNIQHSQELRLADIERRQENLELFKKQATSKMTVSRSIIRNFEGKNLQALTTEERQLLREAVNNESQAKRDLNNAILADMHQAFGLMIHV